MKILINRSDAIGDTILSLPMIEVLKDRFPQSQITFLISRKCQDLFLSYQDVCDVMVYPDERKFIFLWKKMKEGQFDHYIFSGGKHLPTFIASLLRIPFRGGLLSKFSSYLFLNRGVRQKRSSVACHEALYNLKLLEPLGIHTQEVIPPHIQLREEEKSGLNASGSRDGCEIGKAYIVIHPGMTGHSLNWPSRSYARFIDQLEKIYPTRFKFLISMTPSDEPFLVDFRDELVHVAKGADIVFYDGSKKGLRAYMGILSGATFFLGPSTGPMHLSCALKVPVISLFSPIKVQSVKRWGPIPHDRGASAIALTPIVECAGEFQCVGKSCPYFECMGKISVEHVIEMAKKIINEESI